MKSIILVLAFSMLAGTLMAQVEVQLGGDQTNNEEFVSAQVAMINSIGEFRENWVSAGAYYLGFGRIYSTDWALIFQAGYLNFKQNENAEFTDGTHNVIALMFGGRYYILRGKVRPFLLAMNGVNIITEKWTMGDESKDHTIGRYNFQVGVGLSVIMMKKLEIEIQGKYNSHLIEPPVPYNMTGMEVGLAFNYLL
jgi:hypothetical protein